MFNFQNSDQQDQARQGLGIFNEFTSSGNVINDHEVLQLLEILKKETITEGIISKNRLKQMLENYISGQISFISFEEFLNGTTIDSNQRIALEILYYQMAPSQYFQEVIAFRNREQGIDGRSLTLVDLINQVNEIFKKFHFDSAKKSELINSLIKFYNIHGSRILSLDHTKNEKITIQDLAILPDDFKELLVKKLVLSQLSHNPAMGIKAHEQALLDRLAQNQDAEGFSEEKLLIKKNIQEKLFLNLLKSYQLTDQLLEEYRKYFREFDFDLKFKIVSKVWQTSSQASFDKFPEVLLQILRDDNTQNLEDVAFGLLKTARENLRFDDFKQVVNAFCQNKLSHKPLRELAVFEDQGLSYAAEDKIQVDHILSLYVIPIIKNARQYSNASQTSNLGFQMAKHSLESFIESFFSNSANPLISLDSFKEIINAIEENNRYPLTTQQFRELCLIYKAINSSPEFNQYVSSRGVSLEIAQPPVAQHSAPITYKERFNQFTDMLKRTGSGSSSQKLSSATLSAIAKEVKDEILEAKMLQNLGTQKLQDDFSYQLFQRLSTTQVPQDPEQFIAEIKKYLASHDDLKFLDLKKILFYSDRLMKGLGIAEEEISNQLKGLIVFYSQIKLTSFDPKEKKLLDDLMLSYDKNSLIALNPATIFDLQPLPSIAKFDYITKRQLPAILFFEELSKNYLTQEEIYVLAKRFIVDNKGPIPDLGLFLSQVTELVCGSQNQQSKILFMKTLAKKSLAKKSLAEKSVVHESIDSQGIDIFLHDLSFKGEFISELNTKLESLKKESSFPRFKSEIIVFLDKYVGDDSKARYLALQYIAKKIYKKGDLRPWYVQLQNSALEITVSNFELLDESKKNFLIALNQIITKEHTNYRDQNAITDLSRDIQKVFNHHRSLSFTEIKLFLNILFTHKIVQNNYSTQVDLENLKREFLSWLEIQQYPKPDFLQMQSTIVPATRLDDEIIATCSDSLRNALIKFGSQFYQCVPLISNPFSSSQKLTPLQIFKLKIIEFVNQMRQKNFEEVMSAVALQIVSFRGVLTFQEKVDLLVKSVLDYQIGKTDSLEVIGGRILTALKFCFMEPNSLNDTQLKCLKTTLTFNGIIGDISSSGLVLRSLPNHNHQKLLNDIYLNDLLQLSVHWNYANISIEKSVSVTRHIDEDSSTRQGIARREAGADLVFDGSQARSLPQTAGVPNPVNMAGIDEDSSTRQGIARREPGADLGFGYNRVRSLHQSPGAPNPVNFDLNLLPLSELPADSYGSQAISESFNSDSRALGIDGRENLSPPPSPIDNFGGVVPGGYNNQPLLIRDREDSPPPPPPSRNDAQQLRRARTIQSFASDSSKSHEDIPESHSSTRSDQLVRAKSLDYDREKDSGSYWA